VKLFLQAVIWRSRVLSAHKHRSSGPPFVRYSYFYGISVTVNETSSSCMIHVFFFVLVLLPVTQLSASCFPSVIVSKRKLRSTIVQIEPRFFFKTRIFEIICLLVFHAQVLTHSTSGNFRTESEMLSDIKFLSKTIKSKSSYVVCIYACIENKFKVLIHDCA
jgi:hypothetical protein